MKLEQLENATFKITFEDDLEKARFFSFMFPNRTLKAKDVMSILDITRQTLCHYVKKGLIKVSQSYDGSQYTYDYDSVMTMKNKKAKVDIVIANQPYKER